MKLPARLLISVSDGVASLEINRPEKMNSLSPAVLCGIADALGAVFIRGGCPVRCAVGARGEGVFFGNMTSLLSAQAI